MDHRNDGRAHHRRRRTAVGADQWQINGLNTRIDDLDTRLNTRIDELDARLNTRIDDMSARIDELRADVRELRADLVRVDERLDAVEVTVGRIDQRLATIERVVLPSPPAGG